MDSLSSVSPSIMLPSLRRTITTLRRRTIPPLHLPSSRTFWKSKIRCVKSDGGDDDEVEVDRALRLDGTIPGTSDEFVKQVSSRAYDIRRHLHQSIDSSSYDVLDDNPWRDTSKPVYVLTQKENQLCTMKTRMNRSEVERELGMLFSKGWKRGSDFGSQPKQSRSGKKFQMVVEDVREGILRTTYLWLRRCKMKNVHIRIMNHYCMCPGQVFEDQKDAARYCDLLEGGGQGCEGVAEIEASSVFDLCRNARALAVLFRRGRTPPQPDSLQLRLRARKQSLED